MSMPQPPNKPNRIPKDPDPLAKAKDTGMTIADTSTILEMYLLPQHREDPNVIRFIKNYLLCRDTKQAAKESGLHWRDGESLRRRPDVHEAISKVTEAAVLKHGFDASEVVERVKEIARVDPAEMQRDDGSYVEKWSEVPPEVRRAIKKFKAKNLYGKDPNGMDIVIGKVIEVEFWDKMKAVELLGREKELFKETKKVEHDIGKNMRDVLLDSSRRGEEAAIGMRDVGEVAQITGRTVGEVIDGSGTDTKDG